MSCRLLALLLLITATAGAQTPELIGHEVVLDGTQKLLPWTSYDEVMRLSWRKFLEFPVESNGLKTYFTYPWFEGAGENPSLRGIWWAHNPAGLTAMLVDGALAYYAYSGDLEPLTAARELADHTLTHGRTAPDDAWQSVPYASSFPGSVDYGGADDKVICGDDTPCGRGDGVGIIEPDKVGELGYAYLQLFEHSGDEKYLAAALRAGEALALHVRAGDATHSPWPFRVDARTGKMIREEYSANVIGPIRLLRELLRLHASKGVGDRKRLSRARKLAWRWLMKYPVRNQNWQGYFEDIRIHASPDENPNQYSALETARYLLLHPELDPDWRLHVERILAWTTQNFATDWTGRFGLEAGEQWGAEVLSEQRDDMAKMGSHTARFASVLALYASLTGDTEARQRAFRSFNWATYACSTEGVVKVGTNDDQGYWFSDGYGDYLRHFQFGMAYAPEWAPPVASHLLSSTSTLRAVSYTDAQIAYETFDAVAAERLVLPREPVAVYEGGEKLPRARDDGSLGWRTASLPTGAVLLVVKHAGSNRIDIFTDNRPR